MENNQVEHQCFKRVSICRSQVITEMLDHIERVMLNGWAGSWDLGLNGVGDHQTIHLEPVKEDEQLRSVASYRVLCESFFLHEGTNGSAVTTHPRSVPFTWIVRHRALAG